MIQKTTDLNSIHLKVMSIGASGSGKTYFMGSAAVKERLLVLSAESGLLSLKNIVDKDGNQVPIDYVKIEKFEDIEEEYNNLRLGLKTNSVDYTAYTAVGMDSVTDLQISCMDHILDKTKHEVMQQADWGVLAMKMERMIRAFRDLPKHFICTALEEYDTDKNTGEVKIMPMLKGSVQGKIMSYFDEVFYHYTKENAETKKTEYFILTKSTGKFPGKDRDGKLPQTIKDPSFEKIHDIIYKQQPKEKA